ncbi:MAG: hypothetical protein HYY41_06540 [Chloroflexi bacterium]|nr:hypothetical protein [Chloroflexota bacterium]
MFFGLVLIAIGVIMLLIKLGILSGSVWGYAWPIILIILGLSFLGRRLFRRPGSGWWRGGWCCSPTEEKNKQ